MLALCRYIVGTTTYAYNFSWSQTDPSVRRELPIVCLSTHFQMPMITFFFPFSFQNEDLNDLRKSSFNSWVPRLKLFHNSQAGPHVFLFRRWYDASITVCLLCTILRSSLTELHVQYCAKQKESTVTPGQWVCVIFILNLKDFAGHSELVCPPPCRRRMGLFSSHLQRMFHLLWNCVPWSATVNYFIRNCSHWVERVLNI